jgi:hypothetical protein
MPLLRAYKTDGESMSDHSREQDCRSLSTIIPRLLRRIPVRESHLVLCITLLALGSYTVLLTDNLFPGGDNARYLIFTKSLLSGNGYRNIGRLSSPPHTFAPPGFSFLLAPVVLAFGMNIVAAKMLVALFGALSILIVYILFRREHSGLYAIGVSVLYGTAPVVFMYARRVYSDLPFAVVSLLAFRAIEQYTARRFRVDRALLAAILLAASFYLRPVALALLLAATLWLLTKREVSKAGLLVTLVVLLIMPWYYWVSRVGDSAMPGHFSALLSQDSLLESLQVMLSNLASYCQLLAENFWYLTTKALEHLGLFPGPLSYLSYCTIGLAVVFLVAGFSECLWRGIGFREFYVSIYVVVLLSYAFVIDRFIIPILPFAVHYYVRGVTVLMDGIAQRTSIRAYTTDWLRFLLILFLVLSNGAHMVARLYQEQHFPIFSPTAASDYDVAKWASMHLAPSAVVVTNTPDFFYIYSGRQAVDPRTGDLALLGDRAGFVVAEASSGAPLLQWVQRNAEEGVSFHLLYCSDRPKVCLYQIQKPTSGATS